MTARLHLWRTLQPLARPSCNRRAFSTLPADLSRPVQSYISSSRDPYLNLSIEHYLLQKSHPDSSILFIYTNRPCVVIGRNQNPWLEVNLSLLRAANHVDENEDGLEAETHGLGDVDLVRRRSGGGTVFHDEGNVNWTVICPSSRFTRDMHAEMVVRALRANGIHRSRVNERHDIVLDQGRSKSVDTRGPEQDTHSTPWQTATPGRQRPLKVSGSAYKLTRGRALHHGTCLLSSPNLHIIPHFLRSPAKQFIKGRGVESVSSPVGNILIDNDRFIQATQEQFSKLYSAGDSQAEIIGDTWLEVEEVKKGYEELKSLEWTYLQTPQFTISNRPVDVEVALVQQSQSPLINLNVRNGAVTETELLLTDIPRDFTHSLAETLNQRKLHEIGDWHALFNRAGLGTTQSDAFAEWLQEMLPVPSQPISQTRWQSHALPNSVLQAIKSAHET